MHERDFEVHSASHTLPVALEDCRELGSGEKTTVPRHCASVGGITRKKNGSRRRGGERRGETTRSDHGNYRVTCVENGCGL